MEIAMIDDAIVPIEEAMISAHDRSIYFGDGVYEVVRLYDGRVFAMDEHMARFENSLRGVDMLEKVDLGLIRERVSRAIEEAGFGNALVYFHVTRGAAWRTHDYGPDWQPGFLLTVRQYHERQITGKAITHPDWRWKRCDIKSLNLLANVMAKHAATRKGAYEAILVDENGWALEATSSSLLIVKDGILKTAPLTANILAGITRACMLKWADKVGLEVREELFGVDEMVAADEVLITGTGNEVMSLTHIDEMQIGEGQFGPAAQGFKELLVKAMRGEMC